MSKRILLQDVSPLMEETLQAGGEVAFTPAGNSMAPLLRSRQDKIILIKPSDRLKRLDIPLYRRDNGQFVLHRVVAVKKDGYVLCGDNQIQVEPGVRHDQVIAVVKAIYRDGKYIDCKTNTLYRLYCLLWIGLFPIRRMSARLRHWMGRTRSKLYAR